MAVKVAINGFGRIGRLVFRALVEQGLLGDTLDVVAVGDIVPADNLAYLLKYDSTQGRFAGTVGSRKSSPEKPEDDVLIVNGREILVVSAKTPAELPWAKLGVQLVIESTGLFTDADHLADHMREYVCCLQRIDEVFATFDPGTDLEDRVLDNDVTCSLSSDIKRLQDRHTGRQQGREDPGKLGEQVEPGDVAEDRELELDAIQATPAVGGRAIAFQDEIGHEPAEGDHPPSVDLHEIADLDDDPRRQRQAVR